jgi:hypothetical protein
MDPRLRKLEIDYAMVAQQVDSLFDNGSPGILSLLRNALGDKIDSYGQTVSKFIESEPSRKAHLERNVQQAVFDAKEVAKQAQADAEREQNRMHTENRKVAEKTELEVNQLRTNFLRHEKFVQRGIGMLMLGQIVIGLGGFCLAVFTFLGGAAWWIFTHGLIAK